MHELRGHRFFDVFEYNGPRQHWGCFLCNHPDRARDFIQVKKVFYLFSGFFLFGLVGGGVFPTGKVLYS